jgi:rhodanese-related sulfurtransferase
MMGKRLYIIPVLWLAFLLLASAGCNAGSVTPSGSTTTEPSATATNTPAQVSQDLTVAEAYALAQENQNNPDFILLDVRTPEEFTASHLKNAIQIDYYAADFKTEIDKLDRSKAYLVYCRTGHRSGIARDMMKEMGFTRLYNMAGGITEWFAQGYPVVKP